jgi:hypothetical protein
MGKFRQELSVATETHLDSFPFAKMVKNLRRFQKSESVRLIMLESQSDAQN